VPGPFSFEVMSHLLFPPLLVFLRPSRADAGRVTSPVTTLLHVQPRLILGCGDLPIAWFNPFVQMSFFLLPICSHTRYLPLAMFRASSPSHRMDLLLMETRCAPSTIATHYARESGFAHALPFDFYPQQVQGGSLYVPFAAPALS